MSRGGVDLNYGIRSTPPILINGDAAASYEEARYDFFFERGQLYAMKIIQIANCITPNTSSLGEAHK